MVGYGANTALLPLVDPKLMKSPKNVTFYGPQDDTAHRWSTLQAPTEIHEGMYHSSFGPELSAAASLQSLHPGQKIGIVKYAHGGTNLYRQWNPASNDLYRRFLARVRLAVGRLGAPYRFAGLFWMQGETDGDTPDHAQAYGANLTRFIAQLRSDLHTPNLPVVIGQIRDIGPFYHQYRYDGIVRAQQKQVADADPHTFLVSSDGLQTAKGSPAHFSTQGIVDLGQRFVQRAFGL